MFSYSDSTNAITVLSCYHLLFYLHCYCFVGSSAYRNRRDPTHHVQRVPTHRPGQRHHGEVRAHAAEGGMFRNNDYGNSCPERTRIHLLDMAIEKCTSCCLLRVQRETIFYIILDKSKLLVFVMRLFITIINALLCYNLCFWNTELRLSGNYAVSCMEV